VALQVVPLPIKFASGVDTEEDRKSLPATKLADLQNAVFTKKSTLSKRNGYRALSTRLAVDNTAISDVTGLATRQDELLQFAGGRAYSHRPSIDRWVDTGEVSSVVAKAEPLARTGTLQTVPDVATRNGLMVAAWEDSAGGVWCSVLEESSRRILLAAHQLDAAGTMPRCIAVGDRLQVLWAVPASGRIMVAVVNPATPGDAPVQAVLTDDLSVAVPRYDAESVPHGSPLDRPGAIAWLRNGGGYRVGYVTQAGVLSTVATYTDAADGGIAVCAEKCNGSRLAVLWSNGGDLKVRFHLSTDLTSTRTATIGPTTLGWNRMTCEYGAAEADGFPVLYWAADWDSVADSTYSRTYAGRLRMGDSAHDAESTLLRGHALVSRAFHDGPTAKPALAAYDGHVYAAVVHGARYFPYVAVIRLSADAGIAGGSTVSVARLLPGESAGVHVRAVGSARALVQHLSSVPAIGVADADTFGRRHALPLSYRIQLDSENGDQVGETGTRVFELDFDAATSYQSAELGRGLYLAGAQPSHYDGSRWAEAGIHTAPDAGITSTGTPASIVAIAAPTPGAMNPDLESVTYGYKFWYEHVDAQGELHLGPVSAPVLVTLTAAQSAVLIGVPTYRLTARQNVRLCVARSPANSEGTDDEIPYYRVTSTDPTFSTGDNCFLVNDPTQNTVSFTDALSDIELLKREPLYTNGGIASNDPAPWAGDVIAGGKSRLYWTDPCDPDVVRYSKTRQADTALEAPTRFSLRVDSYGGPIAAIGVLDDVVVPFREGAVYKFGGPGPEADGGTLLPDAAFSPVALVTSDVGCIDPGSLGQTPVGLVFNSAKGIRLLDRSFQVVDIGGPVEAYREQRITRTSLVPDRNHLVLLTDAGRSLLWDYYRNQWSTFTNHEGYDAVISGGVYHYLRTDGRVFVETPGLYADDNDHIPMLIETAWIKFVEYLQGWQRIHWAHFLGEWKSAHSLRMRYRRDYRDNWSTPADMDVDANYTPSVYGGGTYGSGPYGGDGSRVYQRGKHLNKRCQAIQFRLEDIEGTDSFGASFELSEMLLLGGVVGPAMKLPAARRT
jgi:hypothetical protein